jgi:amino acid permease
MNNVDIVSVIGVSIVLLLATAVLMLSHVRAWRAFQQQHLDAVEFEYRRRQFRRRMQSSAMLGLLAIAIAVGYLLTVWLRSGWFAALYWVAVLVLLCWIGLLALADMWATRYYFGRLRQENLVEQAKLQSEIRRIQAYQGNGKSRETSPGVPDTGTDEKKGGKPR